MKKIFLVLVVAASILSVSAEVRLESMTGSVPKKMLVKKASEKMLVTRASEDNVMAFGYCNGINSAVGLAGAVLEAAIEIPEELAQKWKGAQVTGIRIGFGRSSNLNVLYYITKDLTDYPITYPPIPSGNITQQLGWNEFDFPEPYTIDGSKFYVGYQTVCGDSGSDFPIGIDMDTEGYSEYGDLVGVNNEWESIGSLYGNVCIQVLLTGDNLPRNDAAVTNIYVPSLVGQDSIFEGGFLVLNKGSNPIKSVDYTFTIADKVVKSGTFTFETPISSGDFAWAVFEDLVCDSLGSDIPVTATITKVNGQEDENEEDNTMTFTTICLEEVYPQNALVEEFTGTWCGWCPRGIVGMEYMKENYSDKGFIGVAVHSGDVMQSPSYVFVANEYTTSYPAAVMNRSYSFDPSSETLETYFNIVTSEPSFAKIDILNADYATEDNAIVIKSSSKFAMDIDRADFQLAFAVVENDLGPYPQTNYFSGGKPDDLDYYLDGWSNMPGTVSTVFNEVGRAIADPFGINHSLPSSIKAGESYEYKVLIPANSVWKLENCYVVAMILEVTSGIVLNSSMCEELGTIASGINTIENDKPEIYNVYNPQGVKVMETKDASSIDTLPTGIYIINGKKIYKK